MYTLNIDPRNPQGNPSAAELRELGVEMARYTFKDYTAAGQPDPDQVRFYTGKVEELARAGIGSLLILSYETYPNKPAPAATDAEWDNYITQFVYRVGQLARIFAAWRPALQIWNEPDLAPQPGYDPTLREAVFGRMLRRSYEAIKAVDPNLQVVVAGLASGFPDWLKRVMESQGGNLPADVVAFHPYGQRPEPDWPSPDWGFGYVGDLIKGYQRVTNKPLWITEIGAHHLSDEAQAEYLRRFYRAITTNFAASVKQVFWFCYSDGMVPPYGLVNNTGLPKPAYAAFRETATARPSPGNGGQQPAPPPVPPATSVSLDRLHYFARYLEQSIVFGHQDQATQRQMETELKGNYQRLSRVDIWYLMQHTLTGSNHPIHQFELDALYALQGQKDLYGLLRSIILATHQKTGALTGRLGVHVRIAAETEANAATNIEAVMQILAHVQPGNRLIITDMVKAMPDESKLVVPDLFETNIYGQHRNGLIENHAWNLQKLVRAIRDRGYQERVILMIRLDGPDAGANFNPFNPISSRKYQLAIAKLIRYLETVLPTVPFKIILGNEPDLFKERQWSDPNVDDRTFTINKFAPAAGAFMKSVARARPDVAFICPALSAILKHDQLAYYTAFFGQERPENLLPALHGYAADVATLPVGQRNLLEQQAEALRALGKFRHITGTEIGSGNPFGDAESLSEKGRFDDVVIWLMLSTEHRAPPGQDNNWSFKINPRVNDPAARNLAEVINRSKQRVLRNIREISGGGLRILQDHGVDRPAYGVAYVNHNTPTTTVAGQTNAVRLDVRNTSYRTWSAGGPNPIRLGYRWYTSDGKEVSTSLWDDNRTNLPYDVPPDTEVTLNCNLGIPRAPGGYEVRWDMIEELKTWFSWQGAPTLNVQLTVVSKEGGGDPPPPPSGVRLAASHNNQQTGDDNLLQAIDNNPYTRWSTRLPQEPGMWFQIDLGEVKTISQIRLNNDNSPRDYPRGYRARVSQDGQSWTTVAENPLNDQPVNIIFNPRQVRLIRIEQTGSDPTFWWSIHQVEISETVKMSLSASHNNVLSGVDNLAQAIDGKPETRWSTQSPQRPGMWFEIDLNESRAVSGLALDTTGSPQDYPRGYIVRLSTDRSQWSEVARKDQNDRPLDVSFTPRSARYIRIEQTGSSDAWWWSIHEVRVKSTKFTPNPTVSASHNNVLSGVDNLAQAIDGKPETRWSTQSPQRPGMWFEIDLNETRTVSGLALDTTGSPQDYPRGYIVRLSTDRSQWSEVARKDQNDRPLDVSFTPRSARYIRIEQTGSSDAWWWSIHEVRVKS